MYIQITASWKNMQTKRLLFRVLFPKCKQRDYGSHLFLGLPHIFGLQGLLPFVLPSHIPLIQQSTVKRTWIFPTPLWLTNSETKKIQVSLVWRVPVEPNLVCYLCINIILDDCPSEPIIVKQQQQQQQMVAGQVGHKGSKWDVI